MTFPRMTLDDGTVLTADVCRTCGGKGTIPAPTTYTVRTQNAIGPFPTPSSGAPIPCPECRTPRKPAG